MSLYGTWTANLSRQQGLGFEGVDCYTIHAAVCLREGRGGGAEDTEPNCRQGPISKPLLRVRYAPHSWFTATRSRRRSGRSSSKLRCSGNPPLDLPQEPSPSDKQHGPVKKQSFWGKWKTNAADMHAQVAKLGLAAVLAYGLFDGITYTIFFILAFLGYEKSTGKNPAANIQALLGIVILMWSGNNVTRPFRVAGAAALAPYIDKGLKKLQQFLKLPNQIYAFMLVVATFASLCISIVGLLILSRWGR